MFPAQESAWDAAGQLLAIRYTGPDGGELERIDYAYDGAGNRIRRDQRYGERVTETPFSAEYDAANRMVSWNGYALRYDRAGHLIERESEAGTIRYTWDARGQLSAIDGPHGQARFRYDPQGRRIEKSVNGVTTGYLYDGMQAIAELQGGSIGATYHTGLMIDEVLARHAGSGDRKVFLRIC